MSPGLCARDSSRVETDAENGTRSSVDDLSHKVTSYLFEVSFRQPGDPLSDIVAPFALLLSVHVSVALYLSDSFLPRNSEETPEIIRESDTFLVRLRFAFQRLR